MPNKCKLTTPKTQAITKMIAEGHFIEVAAKANGISKTTYYNWINEAREIRKQNKKKHSKIEELKLNLLDSVKEAEGKAIEAFAAKIISAGGRNWQAWAWYMQRRWPDLFADYKRMQLEHSGESKLVVELWQPKASKESKKKEEKEK